ncbi:glutathione S-transferase C-terminal domain-containing protein [Rhodovibrionaceae bacterium A322]
MQEKGRQMGMLIEGRWQADVDRFMKKGAFVRETSPFEQHLTAADILAVSSQPERFVLVASYSCPWSHRILLMRKLKGLEGLPLLVAGGPRLEGYAFQQPEQAERLLGRPLQHLHQLYSWADGSYSGRATVPLLWDRKQERIVSNSSSFLMFGLDQVRPVSSSCGPREYSLFPAPYRGQMEALSQRIYGRLANAVYRAGLATRQSAYDQAVEQVFASLAEWDSLLSRQRTLLGTVVTATDWQLFPTLLRFDAVYATHFRCTRKRLVDYPHLWAYARDLFAWKGVAETVDFPAILAGYYLNDGVQNPHGILADLPEVDWSEPAERSHLGAFEVWDPESGTVSQIDPVTLQSHLDFKEKRQKPGQSSGKPGARRLGAFQEVQP